MIGWATKSGNQLAHRERFCWAALLCVVVITLNISVTSPLSAQDRVLTVDSTENHWSLLDSMQVSQDIPGSVGIEAVAKGEFDTSFQSADGAVPNLDGEAGPVWVKASLLNTDSETLTQQIVLKYPQPYSVVFYVEEELGEFATTKRGSGTAISINDGHRFPSARISIPPGEARDIFLRIETPGPILVPLQLYSQDSFARVMTLDSLIFGLLVGCLLAVAAHSCLTFIATKSLNSFRLSSVS